MKTAFVFQHYPPFPGAGARRAKSIVSNYVGSVSSAPHKAVLLTTEREAKEPDVEIITFRYSKTGNKRVFILRALEEFFLGLRVSLHIFFVGYDRVVLSSPSYLAAIPISIMLTLKKIPYVIELRDIYPESFLEAGLVNKGALHYKALKMMSQHLYSKSQGILCATEGLKRLLEPYRNLPKMDVVYNGFDAVNSGRSGKYDDFTVCFHGVLGVFQDIDGLVLIAEKLRELGITLLVIGYGSKEDLIRSSPNINFLGKKSHEETMEIISKCHVGLSLRSNDQISINSFPVKVWEYIGLGIPCIVSPLSEAGEFVESNQFGRQVAFGDYDGVIKAIIDFKDSLDLEPSEYVRAMYSRERTGLAAAEKLAGYF